MSDACNHSKPYPTMTDEARPPHMLSSKARSSRAAAAAQARGAVVWCQPSGRPGEPGGPPSRPISTEWIAGLFAESEDAAAVARFTGATLAQVWAAVWFELGMDARRRYWT